MPRLVTLGAVNIKMYYKDHPPPHVHVVGGGANAAIRIADRAILKGRAGRHLEPALHWIREHEEELLDLWRDAEVAHELTLPWEEDQDG